jgi:regulator of protease activity HflC (stomatin/prohibitin superfamily)
MSQERKAICINGWVAFLIHLSMLVATVVWFSRPTHQEGNDLFPFIGCLLVLFVFSRGYFMIYPNTAKVMTLFGSYVGSVRRAGFLWTNPLYVMKSASLRLQSLQGPILKVNEMRGNPIEISSVMIFHIKDTAQAQFDVHNFDEYVQIQSESSLRYLATNYAYEDDDGHALTIRASVDEVSRALQAELQQRLAKAGVEIDEARITHLAYAPEIALAMLRRQQAAAVISARRLIVDGAVSIVTSALTELSERKVVELDNERKAAMVSNLLVVLCSETQVQPVINAGTLYQ